jgi:hypothetical protein
MGFQTNASANSSNKCMCGLGSLKWGKAPFSYVMRGSYSGGSQAEIPNFPFCPSTSRNRFRGAAAAGIVTGVTEENETAVKSRFCSIPFEQEYCL